ncbi:MAG: threonine synthase [Candidatus Glassbacteria bacterium]|nr:threonine synthase [Candidatus Glassbacteria bacterium]
MGNVIGLKCKESDCARKYPVEPRHICEYCFGKLEVEYDYESIRSSISRQTIEQRSPDMWRYREFLPLKGKPQVGKEVGFTPLTRARNLERVLGHGEVFIKNDAVNYPTLSFKDRVVSVALSKAREFGFDTVACATTGNLGNSLAAQSRQVNLKCFIFMPAELEQGKIIGTAVYGVNVIGIAGNYDNVNRLCTEIADRYGWAFVNINIRPYYAEGSKTFAFEILEQLGWKAPKHIVVPMAGGSLITKVEKALNEFIEAGLVENNETKIHGAQAAGCNPISAAVQSGAEMFTPVRPQTIAHSIAIGNPADGFYAMETIRRTGGWAEDATDKEIVGAIKLLAETEGIFTETAGGVTLAVTKKLIDQGKIPSDESVVISITGNGLKTQEALAGSLKERPVIEAKLEDIEALLSVPA